MINDETISLLSNLFEGVYIVDSQRKIIFWNEGSVNITGYTQDDVMGEHCYNNMLRHVTDDGTQLCFGGCPLHRTLKTGDEMEANVYLHHKDGHRIPVTVRSFPIKDQEGNIVAAVEAFSDLRFKKDVFLENKRLQEMLITDELTQVYNRRYLDFQLKNSINERNDFKQSFGVIFIDIDRFKHVNDVYGHMIGDEILKLVSKTINSNTRSNDYFGRWGGEEFLLILKVVDLFELQKLAEKFRILIEHSDYAIENGEALKVTISLGGTMFNDEDNIETVIERADKFMYEAKTSGRNKSVVK